MSEFNWGDPHPSGTDPATRKYEARKRTATCYVGKLAKVAACFETGGKGAREGFVLFGEEVDNFLAWQAWASHLFKSNMDDDFAAVTCRDFALNCETPAGKRLSPEDRIRWWEVCLAACRRMGDRHGEALAQSGLGDAWLSRGDGDKAIEYQQQAVVIFKECGDRRREGLALSGLGSACLFHCQVERAIEFFEQALAIAREIGDRRAEGKALGDLGLVWTAVDYDSHAISFHQQRLAIAQETGDSLEEGAASLLLAKSLHSDGRLWEAITHAKHAHTILKDIDFEGARDAHNKLVEWGEIGGPPIRYVPGLGHYFDVRDGSKESGHALKLDVFFRLPGLNRDQSRTAPDDQ